MLSRVDACHRGNAACQYIRSSGTQLRAAAATDREQAGSGINARLRRTWNLHTCQGAVVVAKR